MKILKESKLSPILSAVYPKTENTSTLTKINSVLIP